MASRDDLAHLLRRASFGPRPDELDAAERAGRTATLDRLLAPASPDPGAAPPAAENPGAAPPAPEDPVAALPRSAGRDQRVEARKAQRGQATALTLWWLDRMVAAEHQVPEKLAFFWHGHWATSVRKVEFPALMRAHQQTLHALGGGDFGRLAHAMVRDPALIYWLDGHRNTARAPNENFARELMELFLLGIGGYTEADVREGARALTGWRVDRVAGTAVFDREHHDGATKTVLGRTGAFGAAELVDVLLAQEATARFVTARLWHRFGSGRPVPPRTHTRLVDAYGPGRNITAVLRALLTDPAFDDSRGQLVKQPVEWMVGALRQLGIRPALLKPADRMLLHRGLADLGQLPMQPPSVGGWPAGAAWLTTSATQVRLRVADQIAARTSPAVLDTLATLRPARRPDALAHLLAVDGFTDRTRAVLADAATGRPRRLIALGLVSPEYVVQ